MSTHQPLRVLVVDDDPDIRRSLRTAFELEGYQVHTAIDGDDGLRAYVECEPDVVVLDLVMAGRSGVGFCRALRAAGDRTPILMLTARDAVDDRVTGLDAGADDYLTKPFALVELFARVRALVRRAGPGAGETVLGVGLDSASRVAKRNGVTMQLTAIETVILEVFLQNPGQTITRDTLADAIWGADSSPRSNAIDVYIGYLRTKLEAEDSPRVIHTVRGLGYRFAAS